MNYESYHQKKKMNHIIKILSMISMDHIYPKG
jgi:hypothetical protein